jgi:hypothetical protein
VRDDESPANCPGRCWRWRRSRSGSGAGRRRYPRPCLFAHWTGAEDDGRVQGRTRRRSQGGSPVTAYKGCGRVRPGSASRGRRFVLTVGRLNATAFAAGENDAEFAKGLPGGNASASAEALKAEWCSNGGRKGRTRRSGQSSSRRRRGMGSLTTAICRTEQRCSDESETRPAGSIAR